MCMFESVFVGMDGSRIFAKQKMMVVMLKVASSDDSTIKIDAKAMLLR